jgi:cell wall-associated protease
MSLGTSQPYTYKGYCDSILPSLTNAINYAVSKNVAVVSAAGNSGNAGVSIPGCISSSITVGAVDKYDKIASFSGRGNSLDVTAPGVNLLSAWTGTNYIYASGTSMATPVTSGTVALIKYQHPTYTVSQVRNALIKTAKDLGKKGFDKDYGYGRIDSYSATIYNA